MLQEFPLSMISRRMQCGRRLARRFKRYAKKMKDSRKSVKDVEKNSMLSDARLSFATSIEFELSR